MSDPTLSDIDFKKMAGVRTTLDLINLLIYEFDCRSKETRRSFIHFFDCVSCQYCFFETICVVSYHNKFVLMW